MTTLALTDAVNSTVADASLVNNNNTALKAVVNGHIDNANIDPAAAIADTKLNLSNVLPWLIDISPIPTAISQTNWDTIAIDTSQAGAAVKSSTNVQNAEINFDVILSAGTWTVEWVTLKDANVGIYKVQIDGVTAGTADGYSAAPSYNQRLSVAGITVASTGKKRLKFLMDTKNASSSNYRGVLSHVQLRRTA